MATSGNSSWELTRDNIIAAALRKIGVLSEGQVATSEQITNATTALNGVVALFQTKGMPLWKRTVQNIALVAGQQNYTIAEAVKLPQVSLRSLLGSTQYELQPKSLYDFYQLPQAAANPSTPVHYYFQPGISDGTVALWPVPDAAAVAQYGLVIVKQEKFDGFFLANETPDFPSYYTDALIYSLAARLAPEYGLSPADRQSLRAEAREYTEEAFAYGDDEASLRFQPDFRGW